MHVVRKEPDGDSVPAVQEIPLEVTQDDQDIYDTLVTTELTARQRRQILEPPIQQPRQRTVVGIHWHPEFVPLDLIRRRIDAIFPVREEELLIPTQHNELVSFDDHTGVEVDCYSESFHRKVQLLFHFRTERLDARADVFRSMCEHTRKYRTNQLWDFLDSLVEEEQSHRRHEAADATGVDEDLVELVRRHATRLRTLVRAREAETPLAKLRNKLIRDYMDALRPLYGDRIIHQVQRYVKAVKQIVKRHLPLEYFYRTEEFIEEGRSIGGCIIIPHPEQFWPILLDDLDVDGIEVWNPQSFQYTRFLIDVVHRKNQEKTRDRPVLIAMGDDCHMGEKTKDPRFQDPGKAAREIGLQPPWDQVEVRKRLIMASASRASLIREYRSRMG